MVATNRSEEPMPDFRDPTAVVGYLETVWNHSQPPGVRVKVAYDRPGPANIGGAFYRLSLTADEYGGPQATDVYLSAEEQTKPLSAKITFNFGYIALFLAAQNTLMHRGSQEPTTVSA